MLRVSLWMLASFVVLSGVPCLAADKTVADQAVQFFESKIRPVLAEHCYSCHGPTKQKSELRLDSRAALLQGGARGAAVVPGQPEKSLLLDAVAHKGDLKMPSSKVKLAAHQIADLTQWVKMGAPWPAGKEPATTSTVRRGDQITDQDRAHWAFQPVKKPRTPLVRNQAWVTNPIDAFILARLEAKGLEPSPDAPQRALVRRLYYDLTGLPPTPQEVEAFVADPSPSAYESLVDRLLSSERYGEKWGRHWLDLVRFAETNSYERDDAKPDAWRYRDYVIRSFNDDKPYDRFVREQLAGDEMAEARDGSAPDALIATGYYRLGIWDDEPTDREQASYDGLDDLVATTGQVFLGLTFDCARCHDHKIDPIPQKDYYRLLSFFHNITPYRNGGPTDEVQLVTATDGRLSWAPLPPDAKGPKDKRRKGEPRSDRILCVSEAGSRAPDTYVLLRGNPQAKGDKVEPAFPLILTEKKGTVPLNAGGPSPFFAPQLPMPATDRTTGRRTVLANWIACGDNPLTARVMANRIWQHHFGRGIVRSASNYGLQGDRPTHPELLDWLAAQLVENGWRMKSLHKVILLSHAYRMSSQGNPKALAADPANDLFWRFDMRRLGAEEIRDSILAVSGTLNLKMYGPGVYVNIPREVMAGQSRPGYGWGKSAPAEQARRSIYIHVKRSLLTPILESFDVAETDRSSPNRFTTTQPTQALGMLNSEFINEQALLLAARLGREAGPKVQRQVRLALSLVTDRPPAESEVQRGVRLIEMMQKEDGLSQEQAIRYYCLVMLNLNEFVYLD